MAIIIQPLSLETLEPTIALAEKCFLLDFNADPSRIRTSVEAAIYPDKLTDRFRDLVVPGGIKYWVALDENRVIGMVGYYILTEDQAEAVWISWYCVDPAYRHKKIGLQLLEFIIEKAKSLGKTYLRLFSSDIPAEHRAHEVYKKRGFVPFREPGFDQKTKTVWIYLQLIL
jgi:GNAT superfamily N-acetyltransferase